MNGIARKFCGGGRNTSAQQAFAGPVFVLVLLGSNHEISVQDMKDTHSRVPKLCHCLPFVVPANENVNVATIFWKRARSAAAWPSCARLPVCSAPCCRLVKSLLKQLLQVLDPLFR